MPAKKIILPDIGEVYLVKRRNSKYIRLTISANRQVRVSLPSWVPYAAGATFAVKKSAWIRSQIDKIPPATHLRNNTRVGKNFRLKFITSNTSKISSKIIGSNIFIYTNLPQQDEKVQQRAALACERALRAESTQYLPQRLNELAAKHGFRYKTVKIKKLRSRWGSCSTDGTICLSYYLIQLPWQYIDYVILHELAHTKHHDHSRDFWQTLQISLPDAKYFRKQIRQFRPTLNTSAI